MVPRTDPMRPPLVRYGDLAKMIDHSLVRPELTDDDVIAGCRLARQYDVASVSVRPCDVELAVRELAGSSVKVGSVAGFPHGSTTTAVKLYEARDVLRRGAREIDMVLNIARLRSRQFQYVETELLQMADTCHKEGALLKVNGRDTPYQDQLAWAGMATFPGLPASVAPIGRSREGLPIGVQIIGPFLEDLTPIAVAGLLEREML